MTWEQLVRQTTSGGAFGIKITAEKCARPRTKIRMGADVVKFLGIKPGEFVDVLFDVQNKKIALRKGARERGFQVCGKYRSLTISFTTPKDRRLSVLLAMYGKDLGFTTDGKMAVVSG